MMGDHDNAAVFRRGLIKGHSVDKGGSGVAFPGDTIKGWKQLKKRGFKQTVALISLAVGLAGRGRNWRVLTPSSWMMTIEMAAPTHHFPNTHGSRVWYTWNEKHMTSSNRAPTYCILEGDQSRDNLHRKQSMIPATANDGGLIYRKVMKSASSTSSSVHLRIARNVGRQRRLEEPFYNIRHSVSPEDASITSSSFCRIGWGGRQVADTLTKRPISASFLWTTLREPTTRYLSDFYYQAVSQQQVEPTVANFQNYSLNTPRNRNHSIQRLLSMVTSHNSTGSLHSAATMAWEPTQHDLEESRQAILQGYDFIAVAERLEESLVVLSLLLDIPLGDLLHLDSKRSGGFGVRPLNANQQNGSCFWMVSSKEDNKNASSQRLELDNYLQSSDWKEYVVPEQAIYDLAAHSLDQTIDSLGRDQVAQAVATLKNAQQAAGEICGTVTKFPCSVTGKFRSNTDCLHLDYGCGMECMDRVAEEFGIAGHPGSNEAG